MNKIKDMFKSKKDEFKFRNAGAGHKLSDSTKPSASTSRATNIPEVRQRPRTHGPDENVAKATLARLENKNNANRGITKSTLHDIMTEEKQKINQEMQIKESVEERKKNQLALKEKMEEENKNPYKVFEDSQLFTCPSLDINNSVAFAELMRQIKSSIYDNFNDDPILRSAMCLFNCNRSLNQTDSRLSACLDILLKIISNLLADDVQQLEKFKRIRKSKIEQKVLSLDGALDFLFAIGFTIDSDNEWLVYVDEDDDLKKKMLFIKDLLSEPQIIPIVLDRQLKYLNEDALKASQPDIDTDRMTSAEFKQHYANIQRTREINEMMLSKETKQKLLSTGVNYKPIFTKLRFKFSISIDDPLQTVEAIFYSSETLSDVKTWFVTNFIDSLSKVFADIQFKNGPDLLGDSSLSSSLADLKLSPSATLLVLLK